MTNTNPPKMKVKTKSTSSNQVEVPTLSNKINIDPNAPLTMNDLQRILNDNGYVRREELSNITSTAFVQNGGSRTTNETKSITLQKKTGSGGGSAGSISSSSGGGGLAFPQTSILSNKHIRVGTAISSSIFSMFIAISLQPNLWLIGSIIGAVLGNDIAEKSEKNAVTTIEQDVFIPPPGGLYGDISLKSGKRLALTYLKIWDFLQGVWFMVRIKYTSHHTFFIIRFSVC